MLLRSAKNDSELDRMCFVQEMIFESAFRVSFHQMPSCRKTAYWEAGRRTRVYLPVFLNLLLHPGPPFRPRKVMAMTGVSSENE
jgi:hypothetical protein